MGEISTKKTVDEEILARLQALEVLLMEQRKEIDALKQEISVLKLKQLNPTGNLLTLVSVE